MVPLNILLLTVLIEFVLIAFTSCSGQRPEHKSFADYPGFKEYYKDKCTEETNLSFITKEEKDLVTKFSPVLILPPGSHGPIDFYRDYMPYAVLRRFSDNKIVREKVTPEILKEFQHNKKFYLDFQYDNFLKAKFDKGLSKKVKDATNNTKNPVVYGRIYRERVSFPCKKDENCFRDLTFLKYNIVYPLSGLPAKLPLGYESLLKLIGLNPDDWHELDNFIAIHIVLDEEKNPIAVLLAQHEYHRTYLIGKDISLPPNGKITFNIALRSNEVYPASDAHVPIEHRVVASNFYLKYLLSGDEPPLLRGHDITYGIQAGGKKIFYKLNFLSPCDPFYTATIILGEPRLFFRRYIGRNGPNGANYYAIPQLLSLGNLLKFFYFREGEPDDIELLEHAIDIKRESININQILEYNGEKLYNDIKNE